MSCHRTIRPFANICLCIAMLLTATFLFPVSAATVDGEIVESAPWLTQNPTAMNNAADPFVLQASDGKFYCYATFGGGVGFPVWVTEDFQNWQYHGLAYRPTDNCWGEDLFWAPEVMEYQGKYYMYYTSRSKTGQYLCLGLAISDSPLGPFIDVGDQPLLDLGYAILDSNVLIDDDGKKYLYFVYDWTQRIQDNRNESQIYVIRLSDDMKSVVGEPELLLRPDQGWDEYQCINEGPEILKHNGKYYLIFSGNGYGPLYALGYAVSDSPMGPFVKAEENPILDDTEEVSGPGHNGVFKSPDGKEWWTCYHYSTETTRRLCIDRMGFKADGSLYINGPTTGVQMVPSGTDGYHNIADEATITATKDFNQESLPALTDGYIDVLGTDEPVGLKNTAAVSDSSITFTWDTPQRIVGLMFYNSRSTSPIRIKQIMFDEEDSTGAFTVNATPGDPLALALKPQTAQKMTVVFESLPADTELSEVVVVSKEYTEPAAELPFVTLTTPGGVRSGEDTGGLNGYVGMQFTVGGTPLTVTALGRSFIAGNTQSHKVLLWDVAANKEVASVTVQGGTEGQFTYTKLPSPITLPAGNTYYIASQEYLGGDGWYHCDSFLTFTDVATCDNPCYSLDGLSWGIDNVPQNAYGVPGFLYKAPVNLDNPSKEPISPTTSTTAPSVSEPVVIPDTSDSVWLLAILVIILVSTAGTIGFLLYHKNPFNKTRP